MRRVWMAIAATLLASASSVEAGGPMVFADDGTIVKWGSGASNVVLTLDQGLLGALTNAEADSLVAGVTGVWSAVPQSTANLSVAAGELSQDIDHTNYTTVLNTNIDGINPVVYDVDGLIIDAVAGAGQRNVILAFAGPMWTWTPPTILEGQVVLNGRMLDGIDLGASNPEFTQPMYRGVVIHELGHLLGLGHAQINGLDFTNVDQPTMFPMFDSVTTALTTLAPDDIGWISYIYPTAQYSTSFGSITGEILQRVGVTDQGFQGINVIARLAGGGRIDAASCVSGYVYRAGLGPISLRGTYVIPGLAPGNYTVEVEEVIDFGSEGSNVGPVYPPVGFPGTAGHEYYDGTTESPWDNPNDRTQLSVTAGSARSGINIILNTEPAPALSTSRWPLFK